MNKRIYISGKITGLDIEVAKQLFDNATEKLALEGYRVVNPMALNHDHDLTWESYMRVDLMALLQCNHIYMLKNWRSSKGAIIEHQLAWDLNLTIIFE